MGEAFVVDSQGVRCGYDFGEEVALGELVSWRHMSWVISQMRSEIFSVMRGI